MNEDQPKYIDKDSTIKARKERQSISGLTQDERQVEILFHLKRIESKTSNIALYIAWAFWLIIIGVFIKFLISLGLIFS